MDELCPRLWSSIALYQQMSSTFIAEFALDVYLVDGPTHPHVAAKPLLARSVAAMLAASAVAKLHAFGTHSLSLTHTHTHTPRLEHPKTRTTHKFVFPLVGWVGECVCVFEWLGGFSSSLSLSLTHTLSLSLFRSLFHMGRSIPFILFIVCFCSMSITS